MIKIDAFIEYLLKMWGVINSLYIADMLIFGTDINNSTTIFCHLNLKRKIG